VRSTVADRGARAPTAGEPIRRFRVCFEAPSVAALFPAALGAQYHFMAQLLRLLGREVTKR
jgi:hypothetical protein